MIPKSGYRFSEKIMLHQLAKAGWRFEEKTSGFKALGETLPVLLHASDPRLASLRGKTPFSLTPRAARVRPAGAEEPHGGAIRGMGVARAGDRAGARARAGRRAAAARRSRRPCRRQAAARRNRGRGRPREHERRRA